MSITMIYMLLLIYSIGLGFKFYLRRHGVSRVKIAQ